MQNMLLLINEIHLTMNHESNIKKSNTRFSQKQIQVRAQKFSLKKKKVFSCNSLDIRNNVNRITEKKK